MEMWDLYDFCWRLTLCIVCMPEIVHKRSFMDVFD